MRRLAIIGIIIAIAVLLGETGRAATPPTYLPLLPNCSGVLMGQLGNANSTCGSTALVDDTTSLAALTVGAGTIAHRMGFSTGGDGGAADYVYSASNCVANSRTSNGGDCINSTANSGSWLIVIPKDGLSPLVYEGTAGCNGTTNDSAAFIAAMAVAQKVVAPPNTVCNVGALVVTAGKALDCNNATLDAVAGAAWIVKKTGYASKVLHCNFNDASLVTQASTTLSIAANAGATTITVASPTGIAVGQAIAITMNSGMNFVTRVSGVAGSVVTLADAIPSSATGTSVGSGGGGGAGQYQTGDALIVQGGNGVPAVLTATASAGVLTGVSVSAPGKYHTAPSFPAQVVDASAPGAVGGTVNLTLAGANINNVVRAAFGVLWADASVAGIIDDVRISEAPVAMEFSNLPLSGGSGDYVSNFTINAATIVGAFKDVNVSQMHISHGDIFCYAVSSPHFGPVGIYENGQALTVATGGNFWIGVNAGSCETGIQLSAAQLDYFNNVISDSNRNVGWDIDGSGNMVLTGGPWAASTGFNTSSYKTGIGVHVGNSSALVTIDELQTSVNAADLDVDATSSVALTNWGPTKLLSGTGTSLINPPSKTYDFYTGTAVGGTGTTVYLGPGGATTAPGTAYNIAVEGPVSNMLCSAGAAPGAGQSYVCTLVVNNAGSTPATCTIASSQNNCTYTGPVNGGEAYLHKTEQIYIQVVPAGSGSFSANQFNGFVAQQ